MPYELDRDEVADATRLRLSGYVDLDGLVEGLRALGRFPGYDSRNLIIYEPDAEVELSEADLRTLVAIIRAERPVDVPFGRTAVVAAQDVVFGLNRMYEVFAKDLPASFRVFRDLDEGIAWLREVPARRDP